LASEEIVAEDEDVEGKSTAARRRRPSINGPNGIATAAAATKDTNGISSKRRQQQSKVILLSLQHPEWTGRFCKTVAEVWRWKDAVLGDGRDFFVPRPKTLAALQQYLVSSSSADAEPRIEAVVVLSNCARLELLVVISNNNNNNDRGSVIVFIARSHIARTAPPGLARARSAIWSATPGLAGLHCHRTSNVSPPKQQQQQQQHQ
jgi:hypothetical protein